MACGRYRITHLKIGMDPTTRQLIDAIKTGLLVVAGAPLGNYPSLEAAIHKQRECALHLIQLINAHDINL